MTDFGDKAAERLAERVKFRETVAAEQIGARDRWRTGYTRWFQVHYTLGMLGIVLSTLIASKPALFGIKEEVYGMLAWVLAVSTGIFTFLSPNEKAVRYRRAYSTLSNALTLYRAQRCRIEDVVAAAAQGELIIHESGSAAPPAPIAERPAT
jgi:hypothetical protein